MTNHSPPTTEIRQTMKNTLVIGAGGVANVAAHKCAQNNHILGNICIASRTPAKCDAIVESIRRKGNLKDPDKDLTTRPIDVNDVDATVNLIRETQSEIVINVAANWIAPPLMEACVRTRVPYVDTAVCTDLCTEGQLLPECYAPQWAFRDRFQAARTTGILGTGFDPGVVSFYAMHAYKHHFDTIDAIDILDVNAGNHGRKWATNFDPECNLLEIQGDSFYWDNGQWNRVPCHTRSLTYDFPVVGPYTLYSMAHDEVRSLVEFTDAKHVEFWMAFNDNYLKYFGVLRDIGMLSPDPVTTGNGVTVSPLKVLKAVLPDPASLAPGYTGKTCIGDRIVGEKDGQRKEIFLYNVCDHEKCYQEVESQAISYTAGVPPVASAILIANGTYDVKRLVNVEELDPDPFIELVGEMGLKTEIVTA